MKWSSKLAARVELIIELPKVYLVGSLISIDFYLILI